ncbi:MAG: DUF1576 domain-containing protein [Eubacteriaceae bacterium]|nr:DUF1576 domain-containing protein [Eubacteriaceae bacterium]
MKNLKNDTSALFLLFFTLFSLMLIITGIACGGRDAFIGALHEMLSPEKLTTDSLSDEVGGLGGGLLCVGVTGLIATAVLKFSGATIAGGSFGAYFLMVGFAFFGKNPFNILPIILGTYLYSKAKKQPFAANANMSLFACCMAPAVSELMFGLCNPWGKGAGIVIGLIAGIAIGFLFPTIAAHTVSMHQGYDLFNAGLAGGLFGIVIFMIYKQLVLVPAGTSADYGANSISGGSFPALFNTMLIIVFLLSVALGAYLNGGFKGYGALLSRTGHKTDLALLDGGPLCLINFGILGLFGLGYVNLVGAPISGPVVGALLCMLCWAANGSHVLNVWPLFAGYALAALLQGNISWLAGQGIAVGVMFASGMSPIAGKYRFPWGILAGLLHACLVSYTGAFHGWLNGYNGGFTAGLVCCVLVPVVLSWGGKGKE